MLLCLKKNLQKNTDLILPESVKMLIRLKNIRRRQWQRTRDPFTKQVYLEVKAEIASQIKELRNMRWNLLLSEFDTGSKPFWKITKVIKGKNKLLPPLKHENRMIITDREKANALASAFKRTPTVHNEPVVANMVSSSIICLNEIAIPNDSIEYTRPAEVKSIIKSLKTSKSPGIDNINNMLLKNGSRNLVIILSYLFNACFNLSYFPKAWKHALVVPVPKPNKDSTNPMNYRPISLLCSISKIFERIILKRLQNHITNHSILPNEQFGFRQSHSTNHQAKRLVNIIQDSLRNKHSSGVVLLDVEKAFDNVWHDGLIHKLFLLNTPVYILKLLKDYLSNRTFSVKIMGTTSERISLLSGVPQGAVLSPTLFNIYISDIPTPPECSLLLYADDSALITSSVYPNQIILNLENGINILNAYFAKWKIKLNIEKTQISFFTRRRKSVYLPNRNLKIDYKSISWEDNIKYLGIILDKTLTFNKHIIHSISKVNKLIQILYPFINRKSKLSLQNKLIIFKTIFRSVLTYGAPVWETCSDTHYRKLQITQNKLLKLIYDLPRYYSTRDLHSLDNIELIKDYIIDICQRFQDNAEFSENPLIRRLVHV